MSRKAIATVLWHPGNVGSRDHRRAVLEYRIVVSRTPRHRGNRGEPIFFREPGQELDRDLRRAWKPI